MRYIPPGPGYTPNVYGGLGKPFVAATTSVAGNASSVRALQMFLKNRGYNIAVDGNRGPETSRAVAAYHSGIAPARFNSQGRSTRVTRVPVRPTRTVGPRGAHMGAPAVTRGT